MWIYQPRPGYRFSLDPVVLAGWVLQRGVPARVVDVGAGSGVLGLLLARAGAHVCGVDARAEWAPWARRSAAESGLEHRYSFEVGDVRDLPHRSADLVVSNPPYFSVGSGHLPADPMRAAARHALSGDLDELLPAMARLAPRVAVVLPLRREHEARALLSRVDRPIAHCLRLEPRLVLLEGRQGATTEHLQSCPLRQGTDHHPRIRALYAAAGAPLDAKAAPLPCPTQ